MALNKIIIIGRLTRDPETKYLPDGTPICELRLAQNQRRGNVDEAFFIDVTYFGKKAETVQQHFQKGKPIVVTGRLRFDQWEKDGQKRSKHAIVADGFEFVPTVTADTEQDTDEVPDYGL